MRNSNIKEYIDYPFVISPNIGCPSIMLEDLELIEPSNPQTFTFTLNIVAHQTFSPSKILDQMEGNIFVVPLYDHDPDTRKLKRGSPIPIEITEINENLSLSIESENLQDLYQLKDDRPSFLLRHEFFGEDKRIFSACGSFQISNDHKNFQRLESHLFLMFDLYQTFPAIPHTEDNPIYRICYHSLVIRRENWENLHFVQITDLHVGRRYDELLSSLLAHKIKINFEKLPPVIRKLDLEARFKNPNNKLRKFILWANRQARFNQLDLILITGDIIDYYLKNTTKNKNLYEISESNWESFLNIILKDGMDIREGIEPKNIVDHEELAVPFYTLTGNHDVRVYPYSLHTAGLYRSFGLHFLEAKSFKDPYPRANYKALVVDKYCLRPYYQFVNPFDDYFLSFGQNRFLLMNTRGEKILRMKDLMMANPALKGFSDRQYIFMKTVSSKIMKERGETNNFLITHGPLLNPIIKNVIFRKILGLFKNVKYLHPSMFKEHNLKKITHSKARADPHLNFDYGTISKNWKNSLALMLKYKMINLAGHTHEANEIRYSFSPQDYEKSQPFSIYYDDYTANYSMDTILSQLPIVCQTPSLGIRKLKATEKSGAYRKIEIIGGKIKQMEVKYLSDLETED